MIDHVFLWVRDVARSRAFYAIYLEPLGWGKIGTYRSTPGTKDVADLYGYGDASGASIWLRKGDAGQAAAHVGFAVGERAAVDAAYAAAIAAGARARARARDDGGRQFAHISRQATTRPASSIPMEPASSSSTRADPARRVGQLPRVSVSMLRCHANLGAMKTAVQMGCF